VNCHDAQPLLHPFLDNELDPAAALEFEGHVHECPACARTLAEQKALHAEMKVESLYYRAPAPLRNRLQASLRRRGGRRLGWQWLAAAASVALCVGAGFALGRFTAAPSERERLSQEVASAHIRSLQAEHKVDVPSSDRHTVKPWFSGKLDFAPPVRDVAGFPLAGGRLDYLDGRPVAALVYKRREHVINVFLRPDPTNAETEPRRETRQGYHLIHWSQGGMVYWVVSDLDPAELNELVGRLRE
jgi:anti-sigma factor RsiW